MPAVVAAAVACWLCVALAAPRRPLPGAEIEEIVAMHLLGRWRRLRLIAILATMAALLATALAMPSGAIPDMRAPPIRQRLCTYPPVGSPHCYTHQYDGEWTEEELRDDGTWVGIGTVNVTPRLAKCDRDDALMCAAAR